MIRRPPRSTRTDILSPYTTLFRSARRTMATHSVRSLRSPDCLSFHFSVTAMRRFAIRSPDWKVRISASRSEEHTSELQSLMRISYAVFCLKKKKLIPLRHNVPPLISQYNTNEHYESVERLSH